MSMYSKLREQKAQQEQEVKIKDLDPNEEDWLTIPQDLVNYLKEEQKNRNK